MCSEYVNVAMVTQGAVSTGDEDDNKGDDLDVAHRALNINLDEYVTLNVCAHARTHMHASDLV